MKAKKSNHVFSYRFIYFAIFGIVFLSFVNNVKADTSSIALCINNSSKQYLILNSQYTCPSGFTSVDLDYDISTYDPVSDPNLYLNGNSGSSGSGSDTGNSGTGNGTNDNTNISTTTQSDLNNNNQPVIEDQNVTIEVDPSLAYGPFLNLEPSDYKYCVSLTKDLSYGNKDVNTKGEVSILQAYLTDRGFLETGATGFFGRSTQMAVKRFEYRNQIEVNGVVRRDFRDLLKELTCQKYQKITYVDKPVAKSYSNANSTKITTTKKTTVIPTTKNLSTNKVIPSTNANIGGYVSITPAPTNLNPIPSGPTLDNSRLSSPYGVLSLSKRNNLYFTFNTTSISPTICINTNGVDCSNSLNNNPIKEGVNGNLYEAVNLSGKWSITIYPNSAWGASGTRANIYLRDNVNSNTISIYTVSISN